MSTKSTKINSFRVHNSPRNFSVFQYIPSVSNKSIMNFFKNEMIYVCKNQQIPQFLNRFWISLFRKSQKETPKVKDHNHAWNSNLWILVKRSENEFKNIQTQIQSTTTTLRYETSRYNLLVTNCVKVCPVPTRNNNEWTNGIGRKKNNASNFHLSIKLIDFINASNY